MLTESEILSFRTKNKKRVAVIFPPYGEITSEPGLKIVKLNYGVLPSLTLMYVAGAAKGAGHDVLFLDIHATRQPWEEVVKTLTDFKPDYLLFSVTTYQLANDLMWMRRFKKALNCPIVVGGMHIGLYPMETMAHDVADVGFTGESEISLPEFLECDVMDTKAFANVPGIVYKTEGKWVVTPPAPKVQNLDNVHFPARDLVDNSIYYSFITKHRNFTPFVSSRGCPFKCIFCEQDHESFRGRSAQNVIDELRECYDKYGIREFDFFDSNFTTDKQRVFDICQAIMDSGMKIYWSIRSRVDSLTLDMIEPLEKAGCERIYFGIESADPQVLKNIRKGICVERVKEVIEAVSKSRIDAFGYFMFGSYGDTVESITRTMDYAVTLKLDYAQFSRATPLPNTPWYRMYEEQFGHDYWKDTIVDPDKIPEPIKRPGCELSDEQITELCRQAYVKFYYRPSYIWRRLKTVRSFTEIWRYVKVALMMKFSH